MFVFGGQGCISTGLSVWMVKGCTSLRKTIFFSSLHFQICVLMMQKLSTVKNHGLKYFFFVANCVVVQD